MNILNITLYSDNYGNKLQNYAVQKIINKINLNCSTIIPKFSTSNLIITYIKYFTNKIKILVHKVLNLESFYEKERSKYFKNFNNEFINYYNKSQFLYFVDKNLKDKADYFLYGSDQVWNPNFGGNCDLYLGKFAKKSQNIAFSASFGINSLPKEYLESYKAALMNFKAISVREDAGKKIVEDLTGRKDVEVLVDPTMLLTSKEWKCVAKKPKLLNDEKYILNYFIGNLSKERKNKINELAKLKGYKVINILDKQDPFYATGPSEFVYLEEHAELICTDSFHSCVFGILMNTPFVVFNRESKSTSMNSRLETLLSKFKLEDRYYNGILDESFLKCDYSHCDEILSDEREKANKFLRKALDIKE